MIKIQTAAQQTCLHMGHTKNSYDPYVPYLEIQTKLAAAG
jgi:hypothetical protein